MAPNKPLQSQLKLFGKAVLNIPIWWKWQRDSLTLPLTSKHRKLYWVIHLRFFLTLWRFPSLRNPKTYNEKVQWLKLFDQDIALVAKSDKLAVREFIKSRIGPGHSPELLWSGDDPHQILDLHISPPFVCKTNHDSGSVFILRKGTTDGSLRQVVSNLSRSMAKSYGYGTSEWPYLLIQPKALVEQFIDPGAGCVPADWKFHCVNGRVGWLQFIYDRDSVPREIIVTREGDALDMPLDANFSRGVDFAPPENWARIVQLVEKVAEGQKYVRVDCYMRGSDIFIGELTFFPYGGFYPTQNGPAFGGLLDFSLSDYKYPVISAAYTSEHLA